MEIFLLTMLLSAFVRLGSAMPQGIEPGRIYTPDDLNELRAAIAYEKCLLTLGCDPNSRATCQMNFGTDSAVNVRTNAVCNPMTGEVLWPATGQCVQLLTQGPCPRGHWVKLVENRPEPECAPRPCGEGEALVDGRHCHSLRDGSACPHNQQLLNNEFGRAECDCAPGKVYHQPTNDCYTPYTQGPCSSGQIIKVIDSGDSGRAECVENPCSEPGEVPLDSECHLSTRVGPRTTCHAIDTKGPCVTGFLTVDEGLSEPVCLETHTIFNLPNTKLCPRGSKRDSTGRCRPNFAFNLSSQPPAPVVTSRPGIQPDGALCPPGQVLMAGICLKLALSR